MDNNNDTTNAWLDNSGFNSANSLTLLLDEIQMNFLVQLVYYVDIETFGKQLAQVKNK